MHLYWECENAIYVNKDSLFYTQCVCVWPYMLYNVHLFSHAVQAVLYIIYLQCVYMKPSTSLLYAIKPKTHPPPTCMYKFTDAIPHTRQQKAFVRFI